MIDIKIGRRIA